MQPGATARSLRFLNPRVLSRIANLQLAARTVVEGFIAGLHRSPQHGLSTNFAEYRAYTPGDDLRTIDWNVFARTDRHYIKKFEGETNTRVYVALDISKSMGYRSHGVSKLEYGGMLAASLIYFALRQRDVAGLILFDTDVVNVVPPRLRRGQMMQVLAALDSAQPGRGTDLCAALERVAGFLQQRSLVAVISDLYEEPARLEKALRRLQFGRNDVLVFHVLDPKEQDPDLGEVALLEDMESGQTLDVAPSLARAEYLKLLDAHIASIRKSCHDARLDYRVMGTGEPLDEALFTYLSLRQRRK